MIPLFSPFIPPEAGDEVRAVIDSGWINTGEKERRFRDKLCLKFGLPYCIATNSCTGSLRTSLALLGVGRGDEVITTPWTMPATNTVILEQGAKPVFADIEYDTLNLDPVDVAQKVTDKTKAIMCVHYAGTPCNLDELRKIAEENDIHVVEDAAQALGAKYRGKYIGLGELVCFSFQVIKVITSGDGGAISTTRKDYFEELRKLIWFGIDKENRIDGPLGNLPRDIDVLGFKYNMNDISATLGLVGLRYLDKALTTRRDIAEKYLEALQELDGVETLIYPSYAVPSYWMFPLHVKKRLSFAKYMREKGIEVSVHYPRNDSYTIFGGKWDLPITEKVDDDIIHIPLHAGLTDSQVDKIIKTIRTW